MPQKIKWPFRRKKIDLSFLKLEFYFHTILSSLVIDIYKGLNKKIDRSILMALDLFLIKAIEISSPIKSDHWLSRSVKENLQLFKSLLNELGEISTVKERSRYFDILTEQLQVTFTVYMNKIMQLSAQNESEFQQIEKSFWNLSEPTLVNLHSLITDISNSTSSKLTDLKTTCQKFIIHERK